MKRILVMIVGAGMVLAARSQVVAPGEAALVYYSPKTELVMDIQYTVETHEAGVYAAYAEELLGCTDYVAENSMRYRIDDITIGSRTSANLDRMHKVSADAGIPLLLSMNDKGILKGYNLPLDSKKTRKTMPKEKSKKETTVIRTLPFTEDILKASDSTGMAELVAQQIFHLRETRMYLLNGEVEKSPADGKSMELVLNKLDEQEEALLELFVGKKRFETKHALFTLVADSATQLFYFSAENGFTNSDNIEADTLFVYTSIRAQQYEEKSIVAPATNKKKKNKEQPATPELSPIVYNLPGSAEVKVVYKHQTLAQKQLPYAQAGIDVPLPKNLFTGDNLPTIVFNEKTGNIVSITK